MIPYLIVLLGDFNAHTQNWYRSGKTTYKRIEIDGITSQFCLELLIHEPTHITGDSFSCTDLIFTSQPNLVRESGVHSSLHENCHHQSVYQIQLKSTLPSPIRTRSCHFNKANVDHIRKVIFGFQWKRSFANVNVNEMVYTCKRFLILELQNQVTKLSYAK